eukprot:g4027.t1
MRTPIRFLSGEIVDELEADDFDAIVQAEKPVMALKRHLAALTGIPSAGTAASSPRTAASSEWHRTLTVNFQVAEERRLKRQRQLQDCGSTLEMVGVDKSWLERELHALELQPETFAAREPEILEQQLEQSLKLLEKFIETKQSRDASAEFEWYETLNQMNSIIDRTQRPSLDAASLALAKLPGAKLAGASLVGADLSGADLAGADLRCADLRGARLGLATLAGADLRGAALGPGQGREAADLRGANLSEVQLTAACGFCSPGLVCGSLLKDFSDFWLFALTKLLWLRKLSKLEPETVDKIAEVILQTKSGKKVSETLEKVQNHLQSIKESGVAPLLRNLADSQLKARTGYSSGQLLRIFRVSALQMARDTRELTKLQGYVEKLQETVNENNWDDVIASFSCFYALQMHLQGERSQQVFQLIWKDEDFRGWIQVAQLFVNVVPVNHPPPLIIHNVKKAVKHIKIHAETWEKAISKELAAIELTRTRQSQFFALLVSAISGFFMYIATFLSSVTFQAYQDGRLKIPYLSD